jgi:hypothetical protein
LPVGPEPCPACSRTARIRRLTDPSPSVSPTAVANNTITLRERDSTQQLIGQVDEVVELVRKLSEGTIDWAGATKVLPFYSGEQAL